MKEHNSSMEEEGAIPEDPAAGLVTRKEDGRKIIILERNKQLQKCATPQKA